MNDSTKFVWNKRAYSKHGHNLENWEFVGFSFDFDSFLAAHMLCEKNKRLCRHWATFLKKLGVDKSMSTSGKNSETAPLIRKMLEEFEKQIKHAKV